jgi:peptide/nickel transport system permease protein
MHRAWRSAQVHRSAVLRSRKTEEGPRQRSAGAFSRVFASRGVRWGGGTILVIALVAVLAPWTAPRNPYASTLLARLAPPSWVGGPGGYLLGSDQLGRDLLSRLIFGARVSLVVGVLSVIGAGLVGVALGLVAGFYGGIADRIIMLVTDTMMAFPLVLLALAIVALLGPSLRNLIVVFIVTNWFVYARMSRGATLELREREFIAASRALGASNPRLLRRHVLPNVVGPLVIVASFGIAQIITTEAALGFLGLGVPPPIPSWGNMLADGREYVETAWWISVFPGLALMITAAAFNFLGNGVRDLIDPKLRHVV